MKRLFTEHGIRKQLFPPLNFEDDGCTAVPDFIFYPCCRQHDWLYTVGGTEKDRKTADRLFYDCMLMESNYEDTLVRRIFFRCMATWYFIGVRLLGRPFFDYKLMENK